eukprot:m.17098 g.17098  ORF g.17098 m.17098 type:complete len:386 (+) comp5139_c0_seq1:294-1451(+)
MAPPPAHGDAAKPQDMSEASQSCRRTNSVPLPQQPRDPETAASDEKPHRCGPPDARNLTLSDLPLDIWELLFRECGFNLADLVSLSMVCRGLHTVAHGITTFRLAAARAMANDGLLALIRGWRHPESLPKLPKGIRGKRVAAAWSNLVFVRKVSRDVLAHDAVFGPGTPPENVVEVVHTGVEAYDEVVDLLAVGVRSLKAISLRKLPREELAPAIGRIHTVDLSGSTQLRATRGLGAVHTLNLSYCSALTDVSHLGGVQSLDLTGCAGLTDVSALGAVPKLHLSNCWALSDVRGLGRAGQRELYLSGCKLISEVNHLGGVHTLRLSHCENVHDVSGLGGCHTLYLDGCTNVGDVSALCKVHTLNLCGCLRVRNADRLECYELITP